MNTMDGLIKELTERGFTLSDDDGRLGVIPADRLTDADREAIKLHRSDILAAIKNAEEQRAHADIMAQPTSAAPAVAPAAAAAAQHQAPAEPDPLDAILRIPDADERGRALLDLAGASGGGVVFNARGGLTIHANGKLWRAVVDQIISDRGPVMRLLPNAFVSSSSEDEIIGEVLDAPAATFAEPDPPPGWAPCLKPGATVRDGIKIVVAELNSLCWNRHASAVQAKFEIEAADCLDEPACRAGADFNVAWVRAASGRLITVPRLDA